MMLDYAFMPALRVSGGLRFEYTDIFTDVKLFDELNLPPNHPDRQPATQGGGVNLPSAEPGVLVHYDYLPSINLIYRIHENERINLTARFNYSQSIARPSIRELTPLYQEDFILQKEILGNPKLKIAEIDNFYKKFWNHIEMVDVPYTTWKNAEEAEAYGIELEFLKKLGDHVDFRANVTWIESYAKIQLEQRMATHPMFGQAPYIVNAILGYTSDKNRLSASLSYNVQGQKLALVTVKSDYVETADIYEMPQHLLDFKISKFLGKHFNVAFRVRNILNAPVVRAYDFSTAGLIDYDRYTYGTDYLLTVSINLFN
jgi:outer membrane receptor protein involved in Fe transport